MSGMRTITALTAVAGVFGALAIPFAANLQHVRKTQEVAEAANNALAGTPAEAKPAPKTAPAKATKLDQYK